MDNFNLDLIRRCPDSMKCIKLCVSPATYFWAPAGKKMLFYFLNNYFFFVSTLTSESTYTESASTNQKSYKRNFQL